MFEYIELILCSNNSFRITTNDLKTENIKLKLFHGEFDQKTCTVFYKPDNTVSLSKFLNSIPNEFPNVRILTFYQHNDDLINLNDMCFICSHCKYLECLCVDKQYTYQTTFNYLKMFDFNKNIIHEIFISNNIHGLHLTEDSMLKFFKTIDNFRKINIFDFLLTNEIVKTIIKHNPNCLKYTFDNCGDKYVHNNQHTNIQRYKHTTKYYQHTF